MRIDYQPQTPKCRSPRTSPFPALAPSYRNRLYACSGPFSSYVGKQTTRTAARYQLCLARRLSRTKQPGYIDVKKGVVWSSIIIHFVADPKKKVHVVHIDSGPVRSDLTHIIRQKLCRLHNTAASNRRCWLELSGVLINLNIHHNNICCYLKHLPNIVKQAIK